MREGNSAVRSPRDETGVYPPKGFSSLRFFVTNRRKTRDLRVTCLRPETIAESGFLFGKESDYA